MRTVEHRKLAQPIRLAALQLLLLLPMPPPPLLLLGRATLQFAAAESLERLAKWSRQPGPLLGPQQAQEPLRAPHHQAPH